MPHITYARLGLMDVAAPRPQRTPPLPCPARPSTLARLDIGFLERHARLAVSVLYNALSYVMSYFGWPKEVRDELTDLIDKAMPGLFVDQA